MDEYSYILGEDLVYSYSDEYVKIIKFYGNLFTDFRRMFHDDDWLSTQCNRYYPKNTTPWDVMLREYGLTVENYLNMPVGDVHSHGKVRITDFDKFSVFKMSHL